MKTLAMFVVGLSLFAQSDVYRAAVESQKVKLQDVPIGGWACIDLGGLYFTTENHVWIRNDSIVYEPIRCLLSAIHRISRDAWEVRLLGRSHYNNGGSDASMKPLPYTKASVVIP